MVLQLARHGVPGPANSMKPKTSWIDRVLSGPRPLFLSSLVWNSVLANQMLLDPLWCLQTATRVRPVGFISIELLRSIGGLRLGLATFCLQSLTLPTSHYNSFTLAFVGITQGIIGLTFLRSGRWAGSSLIPYLLVEASLAGGHLLHYLFAPEKPKSE